MADDPALAVVVVRDSEPSSKISTPGGSVRLGSGRRGGSEVAAYDDVMTICSWQAWPVNERKQKHVTSEVHTCQHNNLATVRSLLLLYHLPDVLIETDNIG